MAKWTKEEISILKEYGSNKSLDDLAKLLPRQTKNHISAKRHRLRIPPLPPWKGQLDPTITWMDLTYVERQLLIGSMLGDGGMVKNHNECFFREHHGIKQADYLQWKASKLSHFQPINLKYSSNSCEINAQCHPIFTAMRDMFYPSRHKSSKCFIPAEISEQVDLLALLIWYLDDGTRGGGLGQPQICASGWNYEDLVKCITVINNHLSLHLYILEGPIEPRCTKTSKIIYMPSQDRDVLFPAWQELFREHTIPESMYYKVATKPRQRHIRTSWTDEEKDILYKMGHRAVPMIAHLLPRHSIVAIRAKREQMGIKYDRTTA